ncbi:hypothetical protein PAHAL_2G159300 [Panicum hallii]|uniref:Uncharacterized protein n=1 Tax=Panicum hallii TaxID=206008 RepID=A0A2T8KP68_9POAL|nr:hypothetical protein PAHAL_2G159300 [Panicum hallii]PVH63991.1 hypothetical protein PAHAL_2G159300 [Panicum hallii]
MAVVPCSHARPLRLSIECHRKSLPGPAKEVLRPPASSVPDAANDRRRAASCSRMPSSAGSKSAPSTTRILRTSSSTRFVDCY